MLTAQIYLGQQILLNLLRKDVLYALETTVYSATQYLKKESDLSNSVLYSLLERPQAN